MNPPPDGPESRLNDRVLPILDRDPAIPAHCLLETYSVLTGFPPPHRAPPQVVEEWISQLVGVDVEVIS